MSTGSIDYNHAQNRHSLKGAEIALPYLLEGDAPCSMLDVGCGIGTWLKAARNMGIVDIFGVDGVEIPREQLLFSNELFRRQDLTEPWTLGRRFDVVLCLEVAEHLNKNIAPILVQSLIKHTETIIFSAASPGQMGQHHVNGQWPDYWQQQFNNCGFVCSDHIRWKIWNQKEIEPWYRQNLFVARRNEEMAGKEDRIKPVIHPEMLINLNPRFELLPKQFRLCEDGQMPFKWYVRLLKSNIVNSANQLVKRVLSR
jgi:SAM-dependent methyltransferase